MCSLNNCKPGNSLSAVTVHGTLSIPSSANIDGVSAEDTLLHSEQQRCFLQPAQDDWLPYDITLLIDGCRPQTIWQLEYNFGFFFLKNKERLKSAAFVSMLTPFIKHVTNRKITVPCSGPRGWDRECLRNLGSAVYSDGGWSGIEMRSLFIALYCLSVAHVVPTSFMQWCVAQKTPQRTEPEPLHSKGYPWH